MPVSLHGLIVSDCGHRPWMTTHIDTMFCQVCQVCNVGLFMSSVVRYVRHGSIQCNSTATVGFLVLGSVSFLGSLNSNPRCQDALVVGRWQACWAREDLACKSQVWHTALKFTKTRPRRSDENRDSGALQKWSTTDDIWWHDSEFNQPSSRWKENCNGDSRRGRDPQSDLDIARVSRKNRSVASVQSLQGSQVRSKLISMVSGGFGINKRRDTQALTYN